MSRWVKHKISSFCRSFFDKLSCQLYKATMHPGENLTQKNAMCFQWPNDTDFNAVCIEPNNPWKYSFIESFNTRMRAESPNSELFGILNEAQVLTQRQVRYYNQVRPHSNIGGRPPVPSNNCLCCCLESQISEQGFRPGNRELSTPRCNGWVPLRFESSCRLDTRFFFVNPSYQSAENRTQSK